MPAPAAAVAPPLVSAMTGADSLITVLRRRGAPHDFHLDEAEALALTLFLTDGNAPSSGRLRSRHVNADAAAGRRIFIALNCAGCHSYEGITGRPSAPILAFEGSRAKPDWLRRFLLDPSAIRPAGPAEGPGGRMPDLGLSEQDADSLVTFLRRRTTTITEFRPDSLSAFGRAKAAALLETRYSCLGCHAIDGRGGRIAPDLGRAAARLESAWVRAILDSPDHLVPGTIMPPVIAPAETLDLLASWLTAPVAPSDRAAADEAAPAGDTERSGYLSLVDHPPPQIEVTGPIDYIRLCSACHGEGGRGDGYNARFLRVRPADHTDESAMSIRPDDVLFDAIAAGGRFLDRSPEMPAFGEILDPTAIRRLVAHIRELCSCEGPAWSRDGARR